MEKEVISLLAPTGFGRTKCSNNAEEVSKIWLSTILVLNNDIDRNTNFRTKILSF